MHVTCPTQFKLFLLSNLTLGLNSTTCNYLPCIILCYPTVDPKVTDSYKAVKSHEWMNEPVNLSLFIEASNHRKIGPQTDKKQWNLELGRGRSLCNPPIKSWGSRKRQEEILESVMGSKIHTGRETIWISVEVGADTREVRKAAKGGSPPPWGLSSWLPTFFYSSVLFDQWVRPHCASVSPPGSQSSSSREAANPPSSPVFLTSPSAHESLDINQYSPC